MKKLFLLLLVSVITINLYSQKQDSVIKANPQTCTTYPHYFGIGMGLTTGIGLSYIYWPSRLGVQATVLPIYFSEVFYYSFGFTMLKTIAIGKKSRFYLYLGNHLTNINDESPVYNYNQRYRSAFPMYNIGFGPGFEKGHDRLKFNFRIGYACYNILNTPSLLPTIELGWFYGFK